MLCCAEHALAASPERAAEAVLPADVRGVIAESAAGHGGGHAAPAPSGHNAGHGGGHNAGHGGGHDGGSKAGGHSAGGNHGTVATVSREVLLIAYLMMFYVALNMGLLYLINWNSAYVRSICYKMICTAVSVYCAVLFNQAIITFIVDQVLMGQDGRGLGMTNVNLGTKACVGFLTFFFFIVALNAICWRLRSSKQHLVAATTIGAHIVAFAGIFAFGNLQLSSEFQEWLFDYVPMAEDAAVLSSKDLLKHLSVVLLAAACFAAVLTVSRGVRGRTIKTLRKGYNKLEDSQLAEEWLEEMKEADSEASALVVGFLILQVAILFVTGKEVGIHGGHHVLPPSCVALLSGIGVFLLLLLLVATGVTMRCNMPPGKSSVWNVRNTLGTAMAWCLERAGEWMMHREYFFTDLEEARLASAFILSVVAVVVVMLMNRIADSTKERKDRMVTLKSLTREDVEALDAGDSSAKTSSIREALSPFTVQEQALANIMNGFAVLIGLAWDKAFEAAEETIVRGSPRLSAHPVMAKCSVAAVLISLVLPGWAWYIVPSANKPLRHHFANILRFQEQSRVVEMYQPLSNTVESAVSDPEL